MADPTRWLVLIYRVPSDPSRLRATVWRRVKRLGAIYLQNSVAALPVTSANERALRTLRSEIEEHLGGTAILLVSTPVAGDSELVAAFNAARNDDYEEVVDRCQDFVAEIDKESAAEHFTYGELEENDEDLAKLKGWNDKIQARDYFGASGLKPALEALARCEDALNAFADRVYLEESRQLGQE
jgi:uncharacterized protein YdbL (DUF1318 family)